MSMEIAKSSYVLRLSNILYRWKRCYFALYVDGTIRYFEDENSHSAEETKHMAKATHIDFNLTEHKAPFGHNTDCLFKVTFSNGNEWTFAAASKEDCEIWIMALKECVNNLATRVLPPGTQEVRIAGLRQGVQPVVDYVPVVTTTIGGYRGAVTPGYACQPQLYDRYGNPVCRGNRVVYVDNGRRGRRRRRGDHTMRNVAAGAMIGTMVMSPLLFW